MTITGENSKKPTEVNLPKTTQPKPKPAKFQVIAQLISREPKRVIKKLKHSDAKVNKLRVRTVNLTPIDETEATKFMADIKNPAMNSIQQVLNECHKDIRRFFYTGNIVKYHASAGELIITIDTGVRITIRSLRDGLKHYIIVNKRKEKLLDTITKS